MMDRCKVVEELANDVLETTIDFGIERLEDEKIDQVRSEIITGLIAVLASYMAQCIEDGANQEEGLAMIQKKLNEGIEYRLAESIPRRLHS